MTRISHRGINPSAGVRLHLLSRLAHIVVLTSALAVLLPSSPAADFARGPYLNKVRSTEAQVIVDIGAPQADAPEANEPPSVSVKFGIGDTLDRKVQAIQKSATMKGQFIAQMTDLQPDTAYAYQVESSTGIVSEVHRFRTTSENPRPFSFLVFTDTQSVKEEHERVVKATLRHIENAPEPPAFLLHAGDLVNAPRQDLWDRYFSNSRSLLSSLCAWSAPGNHDNMDGQLLFREMFDLGDVGYQAFRHAGATFILLDSNTLHSDRAQRDWIAKTLESIPPGQGPIVAVLHTPLYSSGQRKPGRIALRRILQPLFEKHGVDIVLSGHEHHYERTNSINGITYFIAGSSGTPVRRIEEGYAGSDFTAFISSPLNFMVFSVNGAMIGGQAIDDTGKIFDVLPDFDWSANDPKPPVTPPQDGR